MSVLLPHMYQHTKFGRSSANYMGISGETQNILGTMLGPRSFGMGRGWSSRNTFMPLVCYHTKFGRSRSNHLGSDVCGSQNKFGDARTLPPWDGGCGDSL